MGNIGKGFELKDSQSLKNIGAGRNESIWTYIKTMNYSQSKKMLIRSMKLRNRLRMEEMQTLIGKMSMQFDCSLRFTFMFEVILRTKIGKSIQLVPDTYFV